MELDLGWRNLKATAPSRDELCLIKCDGYILIAYWEPGSLSYWHVKESYGEEKARDIYNNGSHFKLIGATPDGFDWRNITSWMYFREAMQHGMPTK